MTTETPAQPTLPPVKPDWVFQNGHKIHISPPDIYRLIHDEDYYKEHPMTTEKPTQSTAGNNILSQTEYDAVLSHIRVLSIATHAEHKDLQGIWHLSSSRRSEPRRHHRCAHQTQSLPLVPGLGHEATRANMALQKIFGIHPAAV